MSKTYLCLGKYGQIYQPHPLCIPLISGFADIVTANAVLHHCDDMVKVLMEAARKDRPSGLITDEDQKSELLGIIKVLDYCSKMHGYICRCFGRIR